MFDEFQISDLQRKLLLCFPDACQYRDHFGKFPLDHALEARDPNQTIVQLLVSQHPVLLSFPDESGYNEKKEVI